MSEIQLAFKLKLLASGIKRRAFQSARPSLPHPVPSQEKKGLCVCGEGSVNRVHKYTSARGREGVGRPALPHPRPGPPAASGDRVAVPGATGRRSPGRRGGRGCCAAGDQRAGPGRADLGGTLQARAGAQAALCPPPPGTQGPPPPPAVAPHALAPIPCRACPLLLRSSRSAARPPRCRPWSAGPPGSPRPPDPGFPGGGGRLGRWRRRRRPPRDSPRHIPPQPPDQ